MKNFFFTPVLVMLSCTTIGQAGQFDAGFGNQGIVRTDFGSTQPLYDNQCRQILLHPDGTFYLVFEMNRQTFIVHRFANGALDNSYGFDGYSVPLFMRAPKAVLQPDGKIVVGGTAINDREDFVLARFNTDGSLDNSFSGGKVTTDFFSARDDLFALALQPDGKIVAAGRTYDDVRDRFALARYLADGSLDNSFSDDGKQITGLPVMGGIASIAIQADGKTIAAGYSSNSGIISMAIARYAANGNLDPSFSGDGVQLVTSGWYSVAHATLIQNDGKIVVGGFSLNSYNIMRFMLARLNIDGSFDNSFSTDGVQISDFGGNDASIEALALQPDGKMVVAGFANFTNMPATRDFAAARYNTDGSLDFSFSGDGLSFPNVTLGGIYPFASASSLVLQPDSRIMLAGSCAYDANYAVVRLNTNGTMDASFYGDGILRDYKRAGNTTYNASAVQGDGKIVTAGVTGRPYSNSRQFAVARYNQNGNLDNSFSGDGMLIVDFGFGGAEAFDIAIQPDGKILIAGIASNGATNDFALLRLNKDGSLDNTFSTDGKLLTDISGSDDGAYSVAIQANGKILLGGYSNTGNDKSPIYDFALVRYNADGSLDNSFSRDGILTADFNASSDQAHKVLVQPDGKIVAIGNSETINQSISSLSAEIALMRCNADGSPDLSFDGDGKLVTDIADGSYDYAYTALLQPDGKIVVGGSSSGNVALVRYNSNGSLDNDFSGDGKLVFNPGAGGSVFSIVRQPDGKIIAGGCVTKGFNTDMALVRFNADGSTDLGFSEDGLLVVDLGFGKDCIQSLSVSGSRLYAAGETAYAGQVGLLAAFSIECPINTSIPDATTLDNGVAPNTVYIGYPPATDLTLTAQASNGAPPYSYLWSNGATTPSITVLPLVATTYTVTVSDLSGCTKTVSKWVDVIDIRCGKDKVLICQVPPGNPANSHTNCVSVSAVLTHLNSGSYLGNCKATSKHGNITADKTAIQLEVYPNPSHSKFTLVFHSFEQAPLNLIIWNAQGIIIEQRKCNPEQVISLGDSYKPGIYFAELTQGKNKVYGKLIKTSSPSLKN